MRKILFFLFAFVATASSFAESIPATVSYQWKGNNGSLGFWQSAIESDCQGFNSANGSVYGGVVDQPEPNAIQATYGCRYKYPNEALFTVWTRNVSRYSTALTCPSGQNWTLNGSLCERPDCVAPQSRENDGTCGFPCQPSQIKRDGQCVCDPSVLAAFPTAYGAGMDGTGSTPDGQACVGGCMRKTGSFCLGGGGSWWCEGGAWTSQTCSGGSTSKPKPENKKPPCDAAEGVLTSSSGTVACVPEGTPNARKPDVKRTEEKQTAPNGDVTTKEKVTVKDPATGATSTTETVTSAAGTSTTTTNSGGNGGMGSGTGDNSGAEPGQCAKEPDSPMCKKGTPKEKGKFGSDQDGKLDEAKAQLTAKFNEIKSALASSFASSAASGGGSLPCPAPVTVLGKPVSVCVADYADKLSVIGGIIVFAASIIAILLVVTA